MDNKQVEALRQAGEIIMTGDVVTVSAEDIHRRSDNKHWTKETVFVKTGNKVRAVPNVRDGQYDPVSWKPAFQSGDKVVINVTKYVRGRDGAGDVFEAKLERLDVSPK